jgi:hypothetical protein
MHVQPVPMRREQAKVYLDRECLIDGQDSFASFVQVRLHAFALCFFCSLRSCALS